MLLKLIYTEEGERAASRQMAAYGFALRWQASGCQGTPRDTHDATFTRLGRLWGCLSSRLVGFSSNTQPARIAGA